MRRTRKPKAPSRYEDLSYPALIALAERGVIPLTLVHEITRRRMLERTGGEDPYRHLRESDS